MSVASALRARCRAYAAPGPFLCARSRALAALGNSISDGRKPAKRLAAGRRDQKRALALQRQLDQLELGRGCQPRLSNQREGRQRNQYGCCFWTERHETPFHPLRVAKWIVIFSVMADWRGRAVC